MPLKYGLSIYCFLLQDYSCSILFTKIIEKYTKKARKKPTQQEESIEGSIVFLTEQHMQKK